MPVASKAQALSFLASSVKRKRPALRPETGSTEREGEACQLLRPSPVTADTDRQREGQDWPSGNTVRTDTPAAEALLLSKPAETSSLLTWATSRPARSLFGPSPHPMTLLSRHADAFAQQTGLLCKGQGQGSQQLLGMLAYLPVQSSHIPEDAREHTTAAEGSKPTCRAAASRWKFDRLVKESHWQEMSLQEVIQEAGRCALAQDEASSLEPIKAHSRLPSMLKSKCNPAGCMHVEYTKQGCAIPWIRGFSNSQKFTWQRLSNAFVSASRTSRRYDTWTKCNFCSGPEPQPSRFNLGSPAILWSAVAYCLHSPKNFHPCRPVKSNRYFWACWRYCSVLLARKRLGTTWMCQAKYDMRKPLHSLPGPQAGLQGLFLGPAPHPMTLLSRHPDAFAQQAGLLCKGQGQGSQQLLGMLAYQPVQSSHIPEDAREHTTAAEGSKPTCRAAASRWKLDRLVKESH